MGDGASIHPTGRLALVDPTHGIGQGCDHPGTVEKRGGHTPGADRLLGLGQAEGFPDGNEGIGQEQPAYEGDAGVGDQVVPVEETGPAIPQEQATGPSPIAEKDAERQMGVEGNEALNLERSIEKLQDVGKDSIGEVEGGIGQNPLVAPDIRRRGDEVEKVKQQVGAEDDPESRVVATGIALDFPIHLYPRAR